MFFKKRQKTQTSTANIPAEELYKSNPFITQVVLVNTRTFYDTTWKITTTKGDECEIVRDDVESLSMICKRLEQVTTVDDIMSLDMRAKINYD